MGVRVAGEDVVHQHKNKGEIGENVQRTPDDAHKTHKTTKGKKTKKLRVRIAGGTAVLVKPHTARESHLTPATHRAFSIHGSPLP